MLTFYLFSILFCSCSCQSTTLPPDAAKLCEKDAENIEETFLPQKVFEYIVDNFNGNSSTLDINDVYQMLQHLGPPCDANTLTCHIEDIFRQNGYNLNAKLDYNAFLTICPGMLKVASSSDSLKVDENSTAKPSRAYVWGFGILSVTIISLCSLVGISILPLMKRRFYSKILLFLVSLAVGTLSSNAIFQLIPEGFGIDNDSMTVWRSAVIFGGFYLFYLLDNILERIFESKPDSEKSKNRNESHIPSSSAKANCIDINEISTNTSPSSNTSDCLLIKCDDDHIKSDADIPSQSTSLETNSTEGTTTGCWIFSNYKTIKTVAWMITIADGMHNFIDGLAIGASFSASLVQGISTSIAIFCEEFPHELGDFAILLSAGMSVKQAAFYNFASACCCYLGLIVGILVGHDMESARWIFALAGGVFLYISLAGMLPEAQLQASSAEMKKSPWKTMFIQHSGLLSGFTIMFLLTIFNDKIGSGLGS